MGTSPERKPGTISLLTRTASGNVKSESCNDDLILQALLLVSLPQYNLGDYTLRRGSAVTTQKSELVHKGEWVKYKDNSNRVNFIYLFS